MVTLSKPKKGELVADLGAGDGRIAIAFAKKGALVDAFELDQNLIEKIQKNAMAEGVMENITVRNLDFWKADWEKYDIVSIYPMPDVMEMLEKKLGELKKGARVVVNYYPLKRQESGLKDHIYFYVM